MLIIGDRRPTPERNSGTSDLATRPHHTDTRRLFVNATTLHTLVQYGSECFVKLTM